MTYIGTDVQKQMAINLYELLETQENPQEIMDIMPSIDDLNRWNFNMEGYLDSYNGDVSMHVIDVENPVQNYTINPMSTRMVPLPINYGISILDFMVESWDIEGDWDFELYPMMDEIIRMLVINGAKSSPKIYNKWLRRRDIMMHVPRRRRKYEKIKHYLGLFTTINRLKNVRKRNRNAKTIQRRIRGNRSRLYNDRPTQYMRNIPGLKKSAWNIIDQGLREDEIESPDREIFKTEQFDPLWMSDREIESNRLMGDFVDDLNKRGGRMIY